MAAEPSSIHTTTTKQSFTAHVQELRSRLAWWIICLLAGTTLAYFFNQQIISLLVAPLDQTLYYTSPGGGFTFLIQICIGVGFLVAIPVLIFHIIRFLAPALPKYSTKLLLTTLLASCGLMALGIIFAYVVSLPAALYFLSEFSTQQVQALISTDTYLSFVTIYLAGFALLFQLPLIILLFNYISPVSARALFGKTSWVVLGSFILAAIITPTPDPFNQAIMAGPVIALYLFSACLVWLENRRHSKRSELITAAEVYINLSNKKLVHKAKAHRDGKEGYLCQWESARGKEVIVTFYYDKQHELVQVHR